jgi:hypothetical protein
MITKRLYGLFQKSKGLTQSFNGTTLEAAHSNNQYLGSAYINNYLAAYNSALHNVANEDYEHAGLKLDEAITNLLKVDIGPVAIVKDLWRITELSHLIRDNSPKSKC